MLTLVQRKNLVSILINALNLNLATLVARFFVGGEPRLTVILACAIIGFTLLAAILYLDQ